MFDNGVSMKAGLDIVADVEGAGACFGLKFNTSALTILPSGPVPLISFKEIPRSRARTFASGLAKMRVVVGMDVDAGVGTGLGAAATGLATGSGVGLDDS
jgi:hypothetical protein